MLNLELVHDSEMLFLLVPHILKTSVEQLI